MLKSGKVLNLIEIRTKIDSLREIFGSLEKKIHLSRQTEIRKGKVLKSSFNPIYIHVVMIPIIYLIRSLSSFIVYPLHNTPMTSREYYPGYIFRIVF